jgi:hypothetical protein
VYGDASGNDQRHPKAEPLTVAINRAKSDIDGKASR